MRISDGSSDGCSSDLGRHILLIGHAGHPEDIGTMGQLPEGGMTLIETVEDAQSSAVPADRELAYTTQTTLSVDDTADIVAGLQARLPALHGPKKERSEERRVGKELGSTGRPQE